jgi:hypothetical protein
MNPASWMAWMGWARSRRPPTSSATPWRRTSAGASLRSRATSSWHAPARANANALTHTHAYTRTRSHQCVLTRTRSRTHAHRALAGARTHTHAHTWAHTHAHAQALVEKGKENLMRSDAVLDVPYSACVCVRVCVRVSVRACACACVRASRVPEHGHIRACTRQRAMRALRRCPTRWRCLDRRPSGALPHTADVRRVARCALHAARARTRTHGARGADRRC